MDTGLSEWLDLSKYRIEQHCNYSVEFVKWISNLYHNYSQKQNKRLSENYTSSKIKSMFNNNRFKHGFFIIYHNNKAVAGFGLDEFQRWCVITRFLLMLENQKIHLPIGSGIGIPYAYQYASDVGIGLCSTENVSSKKYMDVIKKRYEKHINKPDLLGEAARALSTVKKLPYTVWYRGVEQYAYTYNTELIPPFVKFGGEPGYRTL